MRILTWDDLIRFIPEAFWRDKSPYSTKFGIHLTDNKCRLGFFCIDDILIEPVIEEDDIWLMLQTKDISHKSVGKTSKDYISVTDLTFNIIVDVFIFDGQLLKSDNKELNERLKLLSIGKMENGKRKSDMGIFLKANTGTLKFGIKE